MSDWEGRKVVPGEGILSLHTIRNRRRILQSFWAWMEARRVGPEDLDVTLLEQWVQGRLRDIQASSLTTESRAVRSWLKRQRRDLADRWSDEVIMPRFTPGEPRALTEAEDRRVMLATQAHQGYILVCLCRWAGLRIDEAISLLRDSVTFIEGRYSLRVQPVPSIGWQPKGHRIRDVPIMDRLIHALRVESTRHDCIFVAARYHHGVWDRWHKRPWRLGSIIQEAADLPKGMAFHSLRRTFATRLAQNGVRIELIQRYLGHAEFNTTRAYIDSTMLEQEGDIEKAV